MTVPWGRAFVFGISLLGANLITLPVEASSDSDASASDSTCSDIVAQSAPDNAQQWLVRSMYASHCYTFQARAVSIDALGVRTLALSHRIRDGIRQQVVQHLDGPSISVERRSPVGRLTWFESSSDTSPSAPDAWARHIATYYDVSLEHEERVAGRTAVKISFSPNDLQRYQHAWWIDEETGLLLKHMLSDTQGRVLETFQMTTLQSPEPYGGAVVSDLPIDITDVEWQVAWLPEGFIDQPIEPVVSEIEQRFFSDGLAAVSVFATPVGDSALDAGVHQIGVSTVAVEFQTLGEQRWQVVGIGELPPAQLLRIVQSVEFE
ncbi:MucB/RseB C-terminal domain-containing protein [Vreelandella olivaria]|uniref:MucB/RseB C-terminal domain-containing protein n=1 Tax=Vreelandella olivaria TaxID=390919 RepID=UPI00201F0DD3|nr:MucB/RseB C-terminal domain-containing protein [Halomonas olivaria]